MNQKPMNPKQLVAEYLETVWVNRKVDDIDRYVAPDLIQHNPNLPDGSKPLRAFMQKLFSELMPQVEWRVIRLIAEKDYVVAHSLAIPAPGQRGMVVVDIYRVENHLIAEHWDLSHDVPEKTASGRPIW